MVIFFFLSLIQFLLPNLFQLKTTNQLYLIIFLVTIVFNLGEYKTSQYHTID